MNWTVRYYKTARGAYPVVEFMHKQDKSTRAKYDRMIDLVVNNGPELGMPHTRRLADGIYELRLRGKNEVRVFYFIFSTGRDVVMLHAFNKRTQKLPSKELDIARNRQKSLT